MSRTMPVDSTEGFRVVVKRYTGRKLTDSIALGSFPTLAGAKSVRTREIREWSREDYYGEPDRTATGRIQRTTTDWKDVE